MSIFTNIYFEALKEGFLFYLEPLENFEFTFFNPLFWVFLLLLLLILLNMWETKKAFQFCVLIAFILLCTTEIESRAAAMFSSPGQLFDTAIIKLISICLVIALFLLYIFLP